MNFWKRQQLAAFFLLFFALGCSSVAKAEGREGWICGPDGCFAAISETKYQGWDAWRLCDGKTEAIVVPAIGRVMSFKTETGENWLWNATFPKGKTPDYGNWNNWGGDKTWLSPQSDWKKLGSEKGWPPPKEWEQTAFQSEVATGGKLKIWGPISSVTGLRISRVFCHNDKGEFVIEQTVRQTKGAPLEAGIWSVTQIDGADVNAVFLPKNEKSDYELGFRQLDKAARAQPKSVSSKLLQITPTLDGAYKIGVDAPRASIAAVRDGKVFVQRAARPDGKYPDGEEGKSGTPVQLYGQGMEKINYLELELLSPLLQFKPGARWTHTVRWSLHQLPSEDVDDAATHAAIDKLLD